MKGKGLTAGPILYLPAVLGGEGKVGNLGAKMNQGRRKVWREAEI